MVKQDYINELNKLKKVNIKTVCNMREFLNFIPKKYFTDEPKIAFEKKWFPRAAIVSHIVDGITCIDATFYENDKKVIIDYRIKDIDPLFPLIRYSGRCVLTEPSLFEFKIAASSINMMLKQGYDAEESRND